MMCSVLALPPPRARRTCCGLSFALSSLTKSRKLGLTRLVLYCLRSSTASWFASVCTPQLLSSCPMALHNPDIWDLAARSR
eukprot:9218785-Heterocapsa_arctica.AAC.1